MLLSERYKSDLQGVLTCYDRILLHSNIAGWCFAEEYSEKMSFLHYYFYSIGVARRYLEYVSEFEILLNPFGRPAVAAVLKIKTCF